MPQKYFADQFDDEEVLFVFRKHPIVMRKGLVFGLFAILLGVIPSLFKPEYSVLIIGFIAGCVLFLILFLPTWIGWHFSVYIVTDQRFIHITQKGLFHRSVVDMSLDQIQMVNYEVAGLQQTMFGFGTIIMQTMVGDLIIHEVEHPASIQKKLLQVLRDQSGPVRTAAPSEDATDEIYETEA